MNQLSSIITLSKLSPLRLVVARKKILAHTIPGEVTGTAAIGTVMEMDGAMTTTMMMGLDGDPEEAVGTITSQEEAVGTITSQEEAVGTITNQEEAMGTITNQEKAVDTIMNPEAVGDMVLDIVADTMKSPCVLLSTELSNGSIVRILGKSFVLFSSNTSAPKLLNTRNKTHNSFSLPL